MPLHPNSLKRTTIKAVPFAMLNADRAIWNHSQTLERLAERGGLSIGEILDNIHDRPLKFTSTTDEDVKEFETLVQEYNKTV